VGALPRICKGEAAFGKIEGNDPKFAMGEGAELQYSTQPISKRRAAQLKKFTAQLFLIVSDQKFAMGE